MNTLHLDPRLALCASFVRKDTRLADIGTDHAYLPVKLACTGQIRSAVAADIRQGPLENARQNILRFGMEDKIRTLLSDGLDELQPDDADDIVMAGMGGELIARLIARTPWLRDSQKHLILQPMTRASELRGWLCENGFRILDEKACMAGKKCYSVMLWVYDGTVRECDDRFRYLGLLPDDPSPEDAAYCRSIRQKLIRKINGLTRSEHPQDAGPYRRILHAIDQKEE